MAYTFRQLKIGGGGLIRGMDIADDGTMLANPDTFGLFLSDGEVPWRDIITTLSMPSDVWTFVYGSGNTGQAPYESGIAKTDSNRIYVVLGSHVYRSEDQGGTFVETNFPADVPMADGYSNNGTTRSYNKRMAIDPINPDHVFVGMPTNGVVYSQNGGDTYTSVSTSTIPLPSTDGAGKRYPLLMAFDPASSASGGRKQGIYVHSRSNGLYRSTNGGTSWSVMSGSPLTCCQLRVGADGYVYAVSDLGGYGNLYVWNGTAWSGAGPAFASVAADPNTAGRVIGITTETDTRTSTDHGATWTTAVAHTQEAPDVPWLELTQGGAPYSFFGGVAFFDPSVANTLYLGEGLGVLRCNPPTGAGAAHWVDFSAGIEEMNPRAIIKPPGGDIIVGVWDQGVFRVPDPDAYTANKGTTNNAAGLAMGWSVDFCAGTPDYIVALVNYAEPGQTGYSQDGGATWTLFDPQPPNFNFASGASRGGTIAVSAGVGVDDTNANICVIGTDNGANPNRIYYTDDGGSTWTASSLPGVPIGGVTGWSNAYYAAIYPLASDRVTSGTFYAVNLGGNVEVSSGSYNSGTGEVTLTLSNVLFGVKPGDVYDIGVAGTGSVASANGSKTAIAGTTGATLKYTIATGLTLTITTGQCYNKSVRGIWRSADGGANFTRVFDGVGNPGFDTGHFGGGRKLRAVPGNAGHLFYTMGISSQCPLMRTTNGGSSWSEVTDMREAWDIGFGAAADGETYPGIIVPGWLDGVWGWWYSADECATWTSIATYPYNCFNGMSCVTGDPEVPGKFYMGLWSNGFLVLDPAFSLTEYTVNWAS